MMSAPWPSLDMLASALAGSGVAGLVYCAVVIRRARRQTEYRPVFEDWTHVALFTVAVSALTLLLIGIHNAWDTVTHIVVTSERNRRPPEND